MTPKTAGNRTVVVIIGSFPGPVHGVSVINQKLLALLQTRDATAEKIDLSPGQASGWRYHLTRAARAAAGIMRILFARPHGVPRYVMSADGGMGLVYNLGLALAIRLRARPLLLYHHSTDYLYRDNLLMRLLLRASGRDAVQVACSEKMLQLLQDRYGGSAPGLVVNNAAWITPPTAHGARNPELTLGHLSSLTEDKGLGRAIETLRELKGRGANALLLIAGKTQGAKARDILDQAQNELGPSLRYLGELTGQSKDAFYAGLDYFLFPSLYPFETQSLVVPEALAAGVPVIAYDHRFVAEVLGDGGLLILESQRFAQTAADWILSGDGMDRKPAAQRRFEQLGQQVQGQLEALLDWALGNGCK